MHALSRDITVVKENCYWEIHSTARIDQKMGIFVVSFLLYNTINHSNPNPFLSYEPIPCQF